MGCVSDKDSAIERLALVVDTHGSTASGYRKYFWRLLELTSFTVNSRYAHYTLITNALSREPYRTPPECQVRYYSLARDP
jgi:hypothetical protein